MKPEIFYSVLLVAIVLIVWIVGSYLAARNQKKDQHKQTREEAERNREMIEAVRSSCEYDMTIYQEDLY